MMDVVQNGVRSSPPPPVDVESLVRWQDSAVPSRRCRLVDDKLHEYSPFPFRPEINQKLVLW
jgi:hypothetical protein